MANLKKKLLFVTLGYRPQGIIVPARKIGFDEIVVFSGSENFSRKDYLEVKEALPIMEEVEVDIFDLWGTYSIIMDRIAHYCDHPHHIGGGIHMDYEASIASSGGTHILRTAAILASWSRPGVNLYVITERGDAVLMPRIPMSSLSVTIGGHDRKDRNKQLILHNLDRSGRYYDDLKSAVPLPEEQFHRALSELLDTGFVEKLSDGDVMLRTTLKGEAVKSFRFY